jgi:hypothetical protein
MSLILSHPALDSRRRVIGILDDADQPLQPRH